MSAIPVSLNSTSASLNSAQVSLQLAKGYNVGCG